MAKSNADLAAEIEAINPGFATSGLNKADLNHMPSAAKGGVKPADYKAPSEDDAPSDDDHVIARGKSVTSLRGILAEGAKVSAEDFANGEAFDALVKRKVIISA